MNRVEPDMTHPYENFLHKVNKPSRYIGIEQGIQAMEANSFSIALCFPEIYEIGMSHLGLKILYHLVNQTSGLSAERCYAPWFDMEEQLREHDEKLRSLETGKALCEFDMVGFSIQSEHVFTNMLNMMELGGIKLLASERKDGPIVIAGGPVCSNPEPMSDFLDVILLGDGEEALVEIMQKVNSCKLSGMEREDILKEISGIPGCYVPCLYSAKTDEAGVFQGMLPVSDSAPTLVKRRWVPELRLEHYPQTPMVPHLQAVQDRHVVEVLRGCTHGCRFCQAGFWYRPVRELSIPEIRKITEQGIAVSGYEEVGLVSLSTADYSDVGSMVEEVASVTVPKKVSISLPSLRADAFSIELAEKVSRVKQNGFTFAPEAGSQRLRQVINKNISDEQLFSAIEAALERGWQLIKLYFMIGLPTETMEDLDETISFVKKLEKLVYSYGRKRRIHVSVGTFIPKAHTPFQWNGFLCAEEAKKRMFYLKDRLSSKTVQFKWQDVRISHYEAILSRGDRSVGKGILAAFKSGSRFEGWSEHFDYQKILSAFEEAGVDIHACEEEKTLDAVLPWQHLDSGVSLSFLQKEYEIAHSENPDITPDCRDGVCHGCGLPGPKSGTKLAHPDGYVDKHEGQESVVEEDLSHWNKGNAFRYLLRYTKSEMSRYLGHSDMARLFQQALRAAGWPLLFTRGFHPRPVLQFGPVLPLGVASCAELMEVFLIRQVDGDDIIRLNNALPKGVDITEMQDLTAEERIAPEVRYPAARFQVHFDKNYHSALEKGMDRWNSAEPLTAMNRNKEVDLRVAILSLEAKGNVLWMDVCSTATHKQNANPFLVLEGIFGIDREEAGSFYMEKTEALELPQ
jgi:radical SAM family uncharacterized protein/radical SAM-linked protein